MYEDSRAIFEVDPSVGRRSDRPAILSAECSYGQFIESFSYGRLAVGFPMEAKTAGLLQL